MAATQLDWSLLIIKTDNGFLCQWKEQLDRDHVKTHRVVIAEVETEDSHVDELKAMGELLKFVKEHFGINYNKKNPKNLRIILEIKEDKEEQQDE